MAGTKNFDFKHKNPADVTAPEKTIPNDEIQDKTIKDESIKPQSQPLKSNATDLHLIKPKAEPRNRRVQLLLTESNYLKLKEYASNGGTSVNDAVNQIIENL